ASWAMTAMSCDSWEQVDASMANPVWRAAITSEWSPKMERAWVAIDRAATWMTVGVSSPAILYMLGSISRRPCEEVKVVERAPVSRAPCTAPAAPASLWSWITRGTTPQRLGLPREDHASDSSPMGDAGVI